MACLIVGQWSRTWASFAAPAVSVTRATGSAISARYWMSLGVSRVVQGMLTAPSFISPRFVSHHSGMRGSITSTRSPFWTPSFSKAWATRLLCSSKWTKV